MIAPACGFENGRNPTIHIWHQKHVLRRERDFS